MKSAGAIELLQRAGDEAAVLAELARLRAEVGRLDAVVAVERALRHGYEAELVSYRLLAKEVLDAAIAEGFGAAPVDADI